jgi:hypothetical protein
MYTRIKKIIYDPFRWFRRHKIVAVFVVIALIVNWWVNTERLIAENSATTAFYGSRGNHEWPTDSRQFILHGIEGGMTLAQVDGLLGGANRTGPPDSGSNPSASWCQYTINYGKPDPVRSGPLDYYVYEKFGVSFDKDDRVTGLWRELYRYDTNELSMHHVDFLNGGELIKM